MGWGRGGRPTLRTCRAEHLRSISALRSLFGDATALGYLTRSEGGLIDFISTAEYCLRVGDRPAALFVALLRRREFHAASQKDEDRACANLKRFLFERPKTSRWLKERQGW
jgi:hypothetical protein